MQPCHMRRRTNGANAETVAFMLTKRACTAMASQAADAIAGTSCKLGQQRQHLYLQLGLLLLQDVCQIGYSGEHCHSDRQGLVLGCCVQHSTCFGQLCM